jgi:hypothetical protein
VTARAPSRLREFVKMRADVEAVLQQVSAEVWDLVLIAVDGTWVRDEFASAEDAEAACRDLDVRLHRDWDDPSMARRMNRRDHWGEPGGQKRAL